jgi:hypothetical protein
MKGKRTKLEEQLCKICKLADAYVDAEIAKGEAFSEPLYDRAWHKAKQNINGEKTSEN